MADDDVIDRDHGFKAMKDAFYAADGTFGRVGILSGAKRYPPKGKQTKGTQVAKVAAVHQAKYGWMSRAIDERASKFRQEEDEAQRRLIAGERAEVILKDICEDIKTDMQHSIQQAGLIDTGLLVDTIAYRVAKEGK